MTDDPSLAGAPSGQWLGQSWLAGQSNHPTVLTCPALPWGIRHSYCCLRGICLLDETSSVL